MADSNIEYTVKVSYMEIYMEKIKDLLARKLSTSFDSAQADNKRTTTTCQSTRTKLAEFMSKA
jgi:kinesin family protein 5